MIGRGMENVKELAAKGIIGGKPLREWLDAPYGAFAKAVRDKIDPYYGFENDDDVPLRKYKVKIRYSYTPYPEPEHSSVTYEVEAASPEEAKEKAEECWDNGDGDTESGEDHEITSIGEPELQPQDNASRESGGSNG